MPHEGPTPVLVLAIRNHFNDKSVLVAQGLRLLLIGMGFMALSFFGAAWRQF